MYSVDFYKLLDECERLENNLKSLLESNASKKAELCKIQNEIIENTEKELHQIIDIEYDLSNELEILKSKKLELNTRLKQFTEINDKINSIVSAAQKANNEKNIINSHQYDNYKLILETVATFEELKADYIKTSEDVNNLGFSYKDEIEMTNKLVGRNIEIVNNLQKNEDLLRVMEQQNRYSEQQFDLILNQIPWEPLSEGYINELRQSKDKTVRDLAEILQIQTNEVRELNTILETKKERKLEILEQLQGQLDIFIKKREEAILIDPDYKTNRMLAKY